MSIFVVSLDLACLKLLSQDFLGLLYLFLNSLSSNSLSL